MMSHKARGVLEDIAWSGAEYTAGQLHRAGYRLLDGKVRTPDGHLLPPITLPEGDLIYRIGPFRLHEKSKLLTCFRRLSEAAE